MLERNILDDNLTLSAYVLRRLLPWCRRALKEGGGFAFELHETCLDEAARLAEEAGFSDVRVTADLAGRPRVLTARKRAV